MVGLRNTLKFQSNFKVLLNWRKKLSMSKDHINNKLIKIINAQQFSTNNIIYVTKNWLIIVCLK